MRKEYRAMEKWGKDEYLGRKTLENSLIHPHETLQTFYTNYIKLVIYGSYQCQN